MGNMNKRKIVLRFLVSPFILAILTFAYGRNLLIHFFKFILYGGEWITYEKEEPKRMKDIYNLLKEQSEKSKNQ